MGQSDAMDERRRFSALVDEPVLAVCGLSGAGKTTLLEAVIPRLVERGLAVAVVKHDAHGLDVDRPGKDSSRLFTAGADVVLRGPGEVLTRRHGDGELEATLLDLLGDHDLVLVEGHKLTPLPKVWLGASPPADVEGIRESWPGYGGREERLLAVVGERLEAAHAARPLRAGILVGGRSERMGRPKQLVEVDGTTMLDRVAQAVAPRCGRPVVLGAGLLPAGWENQVRLFDVADAAGPAAGLVAAMRWAPRSAWLLACCDLPFLDAEAIEWLVAQRRPGRWAVLPSLDGVHPEALLAIYEPQARAVLETHARAGGGPSRVARHPKAALVEVPATLRPGWRDADTPDDLP